MMKFEITELNVYPIKSMGAVSLREVELCSTGFKYDRFWMLVDENGKFITQREIPQLSLFNLSFTKDHLVVEYQNERLKILLETTSLNQELRSTVWSDTINAFVEEDEINQWFSKHLEQKVLLVRASSEGKREVENHNNSKINFSDSEQILILGESSMNELNNRLEHPMNINRFRPNIVFKGGESHVEDSWKIIEINSNQFESTTSCSRCKIVTIEQETAIKSKEPLQTLAKYRREGNKIMFGQFYKITKRINLNLSIGKTILVLK